MKILLKGKKICDKHLLDHRFIDVHPPEMHNATPSLLHVPAHSSLHHDPLHLPTVLSAHWHACPPSYISLLSIHPCPTLESEPQEHTGLVYCVLCCILELRTQKALQK